MHYPKDGKPLIYTDVMSWHAVDDAAFRYVGGDCVVEYQRVCVQEGMTHPKTYAVRIVHGPCGCGDHECEGFDGEPVHERLKRGDVEQWREVWRATQADEEYRMKFRAWHLTGLTDEEHEERKRLDAEGIAQHV